MSWFRLTTLSVLFFIAHSELNDLKCDRTPLQVVSVFDITSTISQFRDQQVKLIDSLRHINKVTKSRKVNYSLIVYHRLPVSLTPLNSSISGNLDKVVEQIEKLNPRHHLEKSSVQALQTAFDQISSNGQPGAKSLILLTHSDGLTPDSLPDILEIKLKLLALNASIFVLANEQPAPSLLHYTNSKSQVYSRPADLPSFYNAIDTTIGACLDDVQPNGVPSHKAFGVRSTNKNVQPGVDCLSSEVDLMIVLDTSGSVQRTFEREQNLAIELINGLDRQSFGSHLQVSVVEFSSDPSIVIGFRQRATKQTILDRLRSISFTGRITRIANAVNYALEEMAEHGNKNSTKIFVLISDGSSLDYWHDVQKTGENLKQSSATVFVASTSSEINFDEMLVYAGGDNRNIFIGARDKIFPLAVGSLIQKCLSGNAEFKNLQSVVETKPTLRNDQFVQKTQTNNKKEETLTTHSEPIITTTTAGTTPVPSNEALHPEFLFTRVKDRKDETPDQLKKQFDDQPANNQNLFSNLSSDEIIANTTEIDENEFEGSGQGQEVKLEESVVKLVSTVSAKQLEATFVNRSKSVPNCTFDLIFVIEAKEPEEKLSIVHKIIDRIPEALIPNQIKPLLVVNGKIVIVSKNEEIKKPVFLDLLQHAKSIESSSLTNKTQLINEIELNKRQKSQLVLLLLSNEINYADQLTQQLNPQHTFSLSSPDPEEINQQTIDLLLPCISASVEQNFNKFVNAGRTSPQATPKPALITEGCENDLIELFVVFSASQSNEDALKAKVQLLSSLPAVFDQPKRIRVSVTSYTSDANLIVPLASSQQKTESIQRVIEQLERSEAPASNFSLVNGLKLSLTDILPSKRPKARLVGLLVVDENLVDQSSSILDIYQTLKGTQADINVLALGNSWNRDSILQYVGGNSSKIYTQLERFIEDAKTHIFDCQNETRVYSKVEDVDVFDEKISDLFRRSDNAIQPNESPNTSSQCKDVDLILVLDTSTSVEKAFNRQLQFALDLVKHLPSDGIESGKVQVGIASFYVQARGELGLGSLRQKDAILDTISSIKHTGGSTFIANGLKLAIEMVRKRTRQSAQLAIVLISDGNSQDEWQTVLSTAAQLRLLNADLYALTASHDFFFRELEIYADKNVFTDAQFDEFLTKIDSSILAGCSSVSSSFVARDEKIASTTAKPTTLTTTSARSTQTLKTDDCKDDQVDVMFVLDTSTSTASQFYSQRKLVQNLVKILPLDEGQLRTALIHFNSTSKLHFGFSSNQSQAEILNKIQQIIYTGGNTSLVAGVEGSLEEINAHSRHPKARLIVLLLSAGNSQDGWTQVQLVSKKLKQLKNANIFAVTLSNAYYFDELREYTGNERNIYTDERVDDFIQEIGQQILSCDNRGPKKDLNKETTTQKPAINLSKDPKTEFAARDESPVVVKDECKFAKIDLILILDASTSRESVFEHQRELALSLIERLPISRGDTHVSIGLNSFVHVPTMRLTLGLGRDRTMVRKAIEDIEFIGGSTLTSQAIELAIKDLEKGRRHDAVQILVLFNDGMSQDKWETVEETSLHLHKVNAELFGVALGDNVDLRELQLYIKRKERIYRDGAAETERFLQDVVSLLRNDTNGNCPLFFSDPEEETTSLSTSQTEQPCQTSKFDIVVLFDNTDNTANMSDPRLNLNRYLLLDVLGTLPLSQLNVAVFSFGQNAQLVFDLTTESEKDVLFEKIEAIQPQKGRASYATSVMEALEYYKRNHRSNAQGLFLIVGDGQNTTDDTEKRSLAANQLRRTEGLIAQAVSSNKDVNLQTLIAYTGSISNVFNYDRNAEFAKNILKLATTANSECLKATTVKPKVIEPKDLKVAQPILRDIASASVDKSLVVGDSEKLLKKPLKSTTQKSLEQTTKTLKIEKSTKPSSLTKSTKPSNSTSSTKPSIQSTTTTPKVPIKLTNITSNCEVDLMIIIDTSGSVNETLEHAKTIAKRLVEEFNVEKSNTHVSIVKFSSKARTVHSFGDLQIKEDVLEKLDSIHLTVGSTTALHEALLKAISEYTPARGARLKKAQSLAVVFTDGFGQKDMSVEAGLLREIASVYAVAINHDYPISRKGLEDLTGDSKRVFTDANINDLYTLLKQHLARCQKL